MVTSMSAAPIPQKHEHMFTMFRSSDDRVFLTMYPTELK